MWQKILIIIDINQTMRPEDSKSNSNKINIVKTIFTLLSKIKSTITNVFELVETFILLTLQTAEGKI